MATTRGRVYGSRPVGALAEWLSTGRTAVVGVVSVTLVGLFARLLRLGARPMHFDEARVAFWILRANRTGEWQYRFIIHGPLVQHANRLLFDLFGTGDFVARLPVALVGAALPLAALLYRDRLRELEVVALAGVLALNPLLLYYSRFMRSDLLVGAFAFVTLGLLVRLYETRRPAYLYAASLAFALSFASKENAVVYVLCWGGMFGLVAGLEVLDPRRFRTRGRMVRRVRSLVADLRGRADGPWLARVVGHAVGAVALFLLATFFLFAPRAPPGGGVGLYQSPLPATVGATVDSMEAGYNHWVGGSSEIAGCLGGAEGFWGKYACNLGRELSVLGRTSAAVGLLSLVGLLREFRAETPRVLVPAAFYWGVASLLGYPLGTDIIFPPWVTIHAVIPLAIPAAVGLVALGGWALDAVGARDGVSAAVTVVAVLVLVVSSLGVGAHFAYVAPTAYSTDSPAMVQFAQPEQAMNDAIAATERASAANEGLDVVVFNRDPDDGNSLVDMGGVNDRTVPCMRFIRGLPISWYLWSFDAQVDCADSRESLSTQLESEPPVVITQPNSFSALREFLDEDRHVVARYNNRGNGREVVYVFDTTQVDAPAEAVPPSRAGDASAVGDPSGTAVEAASGPGSSGGEGAGSGSSGGEGAVDAGSVTDALDNA